MSDVRKYDRLLRTARDSFLFILLRRRRVKPHLLWQEKKASEPMVLSLEKLEKFALEQTLRESLGNKSKAAEILGISRDTLYRMLRQFGIE